MESTEERGWIEEQRTVGKDQPPLADTLEHVFGAATLADGTSGQVDELVAVLVNASEELGNPRLRPVPANDGHNLAKNVRSGRGGIRDFIYMFGLKLKRNISYHGRIQFVEEKGIVKVTATILKQ